MVALYIISGVCALVSVLALAAAYVYERADQAVSDASDH